MFLLVVILFEKECENSLKSESDDNPVDSIIRLEVTMKTGGTHNFCLGNHEKTASISFFLGSNSVYA